MSIVNREKFLQGLTKSGILREDALKQWLAKVGPDANTKTLARDLISKKLLTRWQAKMLLKGAWRLKFGNYLLTDRVDRTEFGDRFCATHQQLSRDVFIQYLPIEFSDSRESRKKVFSLGSKLSELDHPNLVHVYDVDEERERVYLVSEVAKGKGLQELLAESPSQSIASVARIVRGCLSGVSYAHSSDVVFGSISNETIVVRPDGEPKICGLTQFAVQNELAESPAAASDDLAAVLKIAKSLLRSVSESERTTESFSELKTAIVSMGKDPKGAIATLDELVRLESDSSLDDGEIKLAPASPRAEATAHPATGIARPNSRPASEHPFGSDDPGAVDFEESEGFLTSLARRNPVALIATSAVAALLLIGGTVFAASKLVTTPAAVADAGLESPEVAGGKNDSTKPKKKKRGSNDRKAAKVERPDFRNRQGALSGDAPGTAPASAVDPNANLAAIDAIFNNGEGGKSKPVEVVKAGPAVESPVATETKLAVPDPPAEKKEDATPPKDEPAPVKVATTPPQKKSPKAETVKQKKATKQDGEFLAAGADPFKGFVTVVDLPEIGSTDQISFGKLILEKRHLLGAEILSTPTAHRSKPIFELARSSDDKQAWDISFIKKKRKSQPVVVAKLQKTANELKFNWTSDAANLEVANYLRNCRVKISTATHSHWLTLRKPRKIEGFLLGKDKGQVQVNYEIPFMPNPIALAAVASGIRFERMDKKNSKQKAYLEPAGITPSAPARMYFHNVAYRFLSLDVGISLKKKVKLKAALVIQPEDQAPVVLEDPRAITQFGVQVRQAALQAQEVAKQAKVAMEQKKISKDEEKAYADAAKKATGQAALTKYYEHVVPQLVEKEIPVLITYALDDQHRIILAYTAETAETKKK